MQQSSDGCVCARVCLREAWRCGGVAVCGVVQLSCPVCRAKIRFVAPSFALRALANDARDAAHRALRAHASASASAPASAGAAVEGAPDPQPAPQPAPEPDRLLAPAAVEVDVCHSAKSGREDGLLTKALV